MNPIWVDHKGAVVGHGPVTAIDPGTGTERYHAALEAIRASGKPMGFASFTFDPAEADSMVAIPHTTSLHAPRPKAAVDGGPDIIDDGIAAWREGFQAAMRAISQGRVAKVVLARRVVVEMGASPDPEGIVARLGQDNPGCYLFSVAGLVGASPELLVSLRRGRVRSLALAGTATDPGQLATAKISEEHRHVAESVRRTLEPHMSGVEVTEQVVVSHGAMSHAGTRIEGPAVPGTTITEILADLHPTAAVAGAPDREAIELIREIEPGSRGRYAGPVGWLDDSGDGVFAIALRCGQIDGTRVTLHAGGGLVPGSEEDAELAETELKLAPMLTALGQLRRR